MTASASGSSALSHDPVDHTTGHDTHDTHDTHDDGHGPAEDPKWVLVPLVIGLVIGLVIAVVFGLASGVRSIV